MNVLVSLSYDNIRAIEQARHILAAQEAMGQQHGTVVDDLGDILGMARRERLHSVRADRLDHVGASSVVPGGLRELGSAVNDPAKRTPTHFAAKGDAA